ncbi:MAG: PAS domain S-box protein [Thermoplasmata archaeon]|nr:PAS domain S-box protein [Thermoplasmata archaeon]
MRERLVDLYNLSSSLTLAGSVEDICSIFSSALQKVLNFDIFALLLKEGNELRIVETLGIYEPGIPLRLDGEKGIVIKCAREKKTVYVPDVSREEAYIEAASGIKSEVSVPVVYGNDLIGVIDVEKKEVDGFSSDDIEILELFASVLAAAFKNVELKNRLKEAEERYREIFENAVMGIYKSTPDGKHLQVNPALAKIYGYDSPESLLASVEDIGKQIYVNPEMRKEFLRLLERDGEVREFISKVYRRDGSIIWIEENARAVKKDGKIVHIVGTVEDITYRKKMDSIRDAMYHIAEASYSAKSLEDLLRSIHETVKELMPAENFFIAIYEEDKGKLSLPYFADEHGEKPEEKKLMRGLTGYVIRNGKSVLVTPKVFEEMERRGEVERISTPSACWLGVPLRMGKKIVGVMAVQDYKNERAYGNEEREMLKLISAQVASAIRRIMAEEALKNSERNYRSIFENSPEGIYRVDMEGRIIEVNPALEKLFGYTREELERMELRHLYRNPREREIFLEKLKKNGYVRNQEIEYVRNDGKTLTGVEYAAIVEEDGERYIDGIIHDVTELKEAEKEADFYNALLRHDVANKLQLIVGYLELLMDEELGGEAKELAGNAMKSCRSALEIIDNVRKLFILKKESSREERDIEEMVDSLVKEYNAEIDARGMEVEKEIKVRKMKTNELFKEVISNILWNAIVHSGGSRIVVKTREEENHILLIIEDDGKGIDDDKRRKIFDMGYKGKESRGSGLGLYLVKKIVEDMNGSIVVRDAENGRGARFEIRIPK